MAGEGDAKARFPRQPVSEGQKHGYIGDVEVYDVEPGSSNVPTAADRASGRPAGKGAAKTKGGGAVDVVTDADVQGTDEGGEG